MELPPHFKINVGVRYLYDPVVSRLGDFFDILMAVSNIFEEIYMASWLVGLMISESIHRNFGITAVFRFHLHYVNYSFSMIFWAVLHTL